MPIKIRLLFLASLLMALLVPLNKYSASTTEDKKLGSYWLTMFPNRPQRVLNFPAYTIGEICIGPHEQAENGQHNIELQGAAKGRVVVPAGKVVTLVASQALFRDPKVINTLPPDGIDCLRLNVTSLADSEDGLCDRALSFVGHLKGLSELNLDRSEATDAGVAHVAELPNLQNLSLFSANCNGSALKQICTLKKLRVFRLSYNAIKDENLQYLGGLTQLEYLNLARTGLTDPGMKYIGKCINLQGLDVSKNPKIGEESLKYVMPLKKLRVLDITGTSISVAGLLKAKKGPSLQVICLPVRTYSAKDMDALSKAFPGVNLRTTRKQHLDEDMGTLLAPLH
jgi:hypothetical protein